MTDRAKAREALKKLDELDRKRREADRLYQEIRRRLEHDAYDTNREAYQRSKGSRSGGPSTCSLCHKPLVYGEEVVEIIDDDGTILRREHYFDCHSAEHRKNQGWVG